MEREKGGRRRGNDEASIAESAAAEREEPNESFQSTKKGILNRSTHAEHGVHAEIARDFLGITKADSLRNAAQSKRDSREENAARGSVEQSGRIPCGFRVEFAWILARDLRGGDCVPRPTGRFERVRACGAAVVSRRVRRARASTS